MFGSPKSSLAATTSVDSFGHIVTATHALIAPSQSLYYACNRERIERHFAQLAALDVELENIRAQALEAGARLTALHQETNGEGVAL